MHSRVGGAVGDGISRVYAGSCVTVKRTAECLILHSNERAGISFASSA
jgi:hypothetical protein